MTLGLTDLYVSLIGFKHNRPYMTNCRLLHFSSLSAALRSEQRSLQALVAHLHYALQPNRQKRQGQIISETDPCFQNYLIGISLSKWFRSHPMCCWVRNETWTESAIFPSTVHDATFMGRSLSAAKHASCCCCCCRWVKLDLNFDTVLHRIGEVINNFGNYCTKPVLSH